MSKEIETVKIKIEQILKDINTAHKDDYEQFRFRVEFSKQELEAIKQAIERNEPMKVIHIRGLTYKCNNCNIEQPTVGNEYCPYCGQKLDWGIDYE